MSQRRRLWLLLGLNVLMIAALVTVGLTAHSLGVLAAGGDYVADSLAILLGILAVTIRDRAGQHSTAPSIVAAINGTALLVVTLLVVLEAVRRLLHGTPQIHGLPVLVVSAVTTAVMVLGVLVLGREAGQEDLHMRSVLIDTVWMPDVGGGRRWWAGHFSEARYVLAGLRPGDRHWRWWGSPPSVCCGMWRGRCGRALPWSWTTDEMANERT